MENFFTSFLSLVPPSATNTLSLHDALPICFLGGAASDRLGPGQTMWVGWLVYAMLAVGMARAGTAAAAWGLFLALGLVSGLTESPERALVARLAGTQQGSGFGTYHGITGFAALVGGVALGTVFQRYGAGPAFLASAAGGLRRVLCFR